MNDETPDVEQSQSPAYRQNQNTPIYGPYGPYQSDDLSMVKIWYQSKAIITGIVSSITAFIFATLKYVGALSLPPDLMEPLKAMFAGIVGFLLVYFTRTGDKKIVSRQTYNQMKDNQIQGQSQQPTSSQQTGADTSSGPGAG